ncbi:DUF6268 family outer membrane beta-barrel protein [Dyadobacter sp. CY323]|uniref:DUF6268 family outer membrane beta-barrel protein n=1 Tax=Dyadobacter sp. CY323 TaxID=2907302 RepID=UPI001F2110BB|nr:DUF6268 family outer membrane beta-barrel protein [Dyadobacter sp. CY323]MCE6991021.1 DUF6268 family outer membrane beta-barrel protein [Dyadobacter sp. CY323]
MLIDYRKAIVFLLCLVHGQSPCQSLKPGLSGMAPSKWLTFRGTHAPGKVYKFPNSGPKTFTHEEFFLRAWLPVVHSKRVTLLLGPSYRTEQFELKTRGENPIGNMAGWNLRSFAMDLNSVIKLDSASWLIATSHFNKSGNLAELSFKEIPLNFTASATFLKKKSASKEIGAGLMVNQSFKTTILPVFIYNYNYAENAGIEIMLPKRVAWRRNLTPNDIVYLKAESVTRTYYLNPFGTDNPDVCRRVDVDMGVTYNRKIGNLMGLELSAGYRKNLSSRLVTGAIPVRTSGFAMTFDLYIQPPSFKKKNSRKL